MEGDDGHVFVDARLNLRPIGKKGDEVHVERTAGDGLDGLDETAHGLGRKRADSERAESSSLAHRNRKVWSCANECHGC